MNISLAIGLPQLFILIILPLLVIIGLIVLFSSRAKHKAKAEILEKMLKEKSEAKD